MATEREGELYRRGDFWLAWDRKRDGSLRSPYPAIFWYDQGAGRTRSASTRTRDVEAAKRALDAHYLEKTSGRAICPHCHQPMPGAGHGFLVTESLTNYLVQIEGRPSAQAIRARVAHVVSYIATLDDPAVTCEQVDAVWIDRFRSWAAKQPIVSETGKERQRAPSTVENSVIQLAAAINASYRRRDTLWPAAFRPLPAQEVNQTPEKRLDVDGLAAAFRYAVTTKKKRENLLRFLQVSVATLARPDAAHDLSTDPDRKQWNSERRVIRLNPKGRRQTKKRRATVIAPWQFALHLDGCNGFFVPVGSVRQAWDAMCADLGWPSDGESGMKLIRRSMGQILRDRGVPDEQLELQMGHRVIDSTTDLYAAFKPEHLASVTSEIEAVISEIEALVPGAFHRTSTGAEATIIPMRGAKRA